MADGRWQMTEDRYISKIVDLWVKKIALPRSCPMIFPCPECFHRSGKRQKNTPGSYLHGGILESKKKSN
jgi:hypothetical protein